MLSKLIATQREIERVIVQVAAAFGCTPEQLRARSKARVFTLPRHLAMYIANAQTGASLPTLGKAFGGRHHTTVLYALERIDQLRETDPEIRKYLMAACSTAPAAVDVVTVHVPVAIDPTLMERKAIGSALQALGEYLTAATEATALLKHLVADLPPQPGPG